jgi:hypothetical protein
MQLLPWTHDLRAAPFSVLLGHDIPNFLILFPIQLVRCEPLISGALCPFHDYIVTPLKKQGSPHILRSMSRMTAAATHILIVLRPATSHESDE